MSVRARRATRYGRRDIPQRPREVEDAETLRGDDEFSHIVPPKVTVGGEKQKSRGKSWHTPEKKNWRRAKKCRSGQTRLMLYAQSNMEVELNKQHVNRREERRLGGRSPPIHLHLRRRRPLTRGPKAQRRDRPPLCHLPTRPSFTSLQ